MSTIAIAGGTGALGALLVAELRARGHDVRALSRGSTEYAIDLTTGRGLERALDGADVVVQAANGPASRRAAAVLVGGTHRLLEASAAHHVCVSIVGTEDVPLADYRVKVAEEQAVRASGRPWTARVGLERRGPAGDHAVSAQRRRRPRDPAPGAAPAAPGARAAGRRPDHRRAGRARHDDVRGLADEALSETFGCHRANLLRPSGSELRVVRPALALLAVAALGVGVPASFAPRTFFERYPFVTDWIDLLPPYNAHLTFDVGGLWLAFGLLFVYAAVRPSRELVVPVCLTWSVAQLRHFAFHVTHLDDFGVAG